MVRELGYENTMVTQKALHSESFLTVAEAQSPRRILSLLMPLFWSMTIRVLVRISFLHFDSQVQSAEHELLFFGPAFLPIPACFTYDLASHPVQFLPCHCPKFKQCRTASLARISLLLCTVFLCAKKKENLWQSSLYFFFLPSFLQSPPPENKIYDLKENVLVLKLNKNLFFIILDNKD